MPGPSNPGLATVKSTGEGMGGFTLKVVQLEVLPTYKTVAAWFSGPPEDTEHLFQCPRRLNLGLNTGRWSLYESREEPNGVRLVHSIDSPSAAALQETKWRPFRGMGQTIFSLPPSPNQTEKSKEGETRGYMVGTISFIHADQ
jgi:hypothetical protein